MYTKVRARRRTRNSFIISLFLHLTVLGFVGIKLPQWYRPPIVEPILVDTIEMVEIQRFHLTTPKKQVSMFTPPAQRIEKRIRPSNPIVPQVRTERKIHAEQPVNEIMPSSSVIRKPPSTDVKLPTSALSLLADTGDESELQTVVDTAIEASQAQPVEIERGFFEKHQKTEPVEQNESADGEAIAEESEPVSPDVQIGNALDAIAESIADGTSTSAVDIVFLLDASGSMEDNIRAVGNHLMHMVKTFEENQIDFTIGVATFKYKARIFPQTRDYQKFERLLANVKCGGDERAYNAIVRSIAWVEFRPNVERRFILVTDEPCKGSYTPHEVLNRCRLANIKLDVIGINDTMQKALAARTGGLWFPIPGS